MNVMRFRLHLLTEGPDAEPTPHDVRVMPADRMRAERASSTELPPSQRGAGAAQAHAETWVLLWLWCAAKRLAVTTEPFSVFADQVADYTRLDADGQELADDEEDQDPETVDPTQPVESTG